MLLQGEENEVLHGCNKKTMKYRRGRVKTKRATYGSWKCVTALMNINRVIAKNKRVGRLCWVFLYSNKNDIYTCKEIELQAGDGGGSEWEKSKCKTAPVS